MELSVTATLGIKREKRSRDISLKILLNHYPTLKAGEVGIKKKESNK